MDSNRFTNAAVAAIFVLICSGCAQDRQQTLIAQGKGIFSAKGCSDCHAAGSSRGPDLSHIGAEKSQSALETWVRNPVVLTNPASKPTPHMPSLNLSEKEAQALTAYLSTLK